MTLRARNLCGAAVGDTVEVALGEGAFLRAAAILYILPLVLLAAGIGAGYFLFGLLFDGLARDALAFAAGVALMLPGFLFIRRNEHRYKQGRFTPMAVAVAADSVQAAHE